VSSFYLKIFFFRAVIGLFIALLVLGTAFDVITRQMSKSKSRNEADIYQNDGAQLKTIMGKPNEGYEADDTVKENGSVDYKYRVSGETELPSFEETKDHTEPYKPGDTKGLELGLWCLKPLSIIVQLYRSGQVY
jgi:hypothetical protein